MILFPEEAEWWFLELQQAGAETPPGFEERLATISQKVMEAVERIEGLDVPVVKKRKVFSGCSEQTP